MLQNRKLQVFVLAMALIVFGWYGINALRARLGRPEQKLYFAERGGLMSVADSQILDAIQARIRQKSRVSEADLAWTLQRMQSDPLHESLDNPAARPRLHLAVFEALRYAAFTSEQTQEVFDAFLPLLRSKNQADRVLWCNMMAALKEKRALFTLSTLAKADADLFVRKHAQKAIESLSYQAT